MPDFLGELPPDVTMGDVFDQVYTRVESLITELDGRRVDAYGQDSSRPIPDTPLEMNWGAGLGGAGETSRSTHLDCTYQNERNALLSIDTFTPAATTYRNPDSVTGYRGSELGGDYSLRKRQSGLIESRLGRLGLFRGRAALRDDERGLPDAVSADPYEELSRLEPIERAQLRVVTRGILDNVTAAELLRDGTPPEEVFGMMGRTLARF